MVKEIVVRGAYGRKYATKEAMSEDWYKGLDFRIESIWPSAPGTYMSIRDVEPGDIVVGMVNNSKTPFVSLASGGRS